MKIFIKENSKKLKSNGESEKKTFNMPKFEERIIDTLYIDQMHSTFHHQLSFRDDILRGKFKFAYGINNRPYAAYWGMYIDPVDFSSIKVELARPIKLAYGKDLWGAVINHENEDQIVDYLRGQSFDGICADYECMIFSVDSLRGSNSTYLLSKNLRRKFKDFYTSLSDANFKKVKTVGYRGYIYYPSKLLDPWCDSDSIVLIRQVRNEYYYADTGFMFNENNLDTVGENIEYGYIAE